MRDLSSIDDGVRFWRLLTCSAHSFSCVNPEGRGLSGEGVRLVLRRRAEQAGVEGTHLKPVSPHGLRAGFVTQATRAGLPDEAIMAHTRHKDAKTMRRYVRRARLLDDSPARKLGL